ncbi:MAG: hypothetical protein RL172_2912 [Bacteroidota bacterium]|jgi:uncharacterized protein (TIGR00730 family)
MQLQSIAVFCGSKDGNNPLYLQHARQLGQLLARQQVCLVYGGGNNGLMGAVATSVIDAGGRAIGIIPELLTGWERQHDGISELIVVENMHMRKRMMYEKSDAVLVLPGGFGTLDELFEVLTWNQLSIHDKPVYILNSGGFYNPLLLHMQQMMDENFLYNPLDTVITILNEPQELFATL